MIYNYKDWISRSPPTVRTANKIFRKIYGNRGLTLPTNNNKKKVNNRQTLKFQRKRGVFARVADLDYSKFYPNIVMGLGLNPSNDTIGAYQFLLKSIIPHTDDENVKFFVTLLCSGWLNCEEFVFLDSEMHRKVLTYGKSIMRQTINIMDSNDKFEVLSVNTDGVYVRTLEKTNIQRHFKELADKINGKINVPFLRIRVKQVLTQFYTKDVNTSWNFNSYSGQFQIRRMGDMWHHLDIRHNNMEEDFE